MKIVFHMMTLDIYIPALLEKIFSEGFLDDYLVHNPHKVSWIQIFQLYLGVKTFLPSLSNITMPPYILNNCVNLNCGTPIDETLKQALELALGGEQYCACNVQLPNGVFVGNIQYHISYSYIKTGISRLTMVLTLPNFVLNNNLAEPVYHI